MSGNQPGQGQLHYEALLQDTRDTVLEGVRDYRYVDESGLGGTHIGKWRSARKATVLFLYENGRGISEAQAFEYGATGKHHARRLDACVNAEQLLAVSGELAECGITEDDINRARSRMGRKGVSKSSFNPPKVSGGSGVLIVRDGKTHTHTVTRPVTLHDLEIKQALLLAERRELLKAQLEKAEKINARLNKASKLSEAEKAELLARHQAKGKEPVIK